MWVFVYIMDYYIIYLNVRKYQGSKYYYSLLRFGNFQLSLTFVSCCCLQSSAKKAGKTTAFEESNNGNCEYAPAQLAHDSRNFWSVT